VKSNKTQPLVYIVILNWNGWKHTLECLSYLSNLNYSKYKILVVDNGSTDDSVYQINQAFPEIKIVQTGKNLGFSGGNNVGIRHALSRNADYILVLNNDTIVDQDFLSPLVANLETNNNIGAVVPRIYLKQEPQKFWAVGGEINWWAGLARSRGRNQVDNHQFSMPQYVDYGPGCCILFSRDSLERVGLFDERFFAYWEDTDWSVRASRLGYRIIYEPQSVIWHEASASTRQKNLNQTNSKRRYAYTYYLSLRNNYWFINKYIKGTKKLTAYFYITLSKLFYYSMAFIILRRWENLVNLWKGALDGWYGPGNEKFFKTNLITNKII
jgi:GT2 family glycosyltransferase